MTLLYRPGARMPIGALNNPVLVLNNAKTIILLPKSKSKANCIKRVVSWIKVSQVSLDLALFSVLHKAIILKIIAKKKKGVSCRVLIYRHLMEGFRREKNLNYIDLLIRAGVEVRWATAEVVPLGMYRMCLIDCRDPTGRSACCWLYGKQADYPGTYQITNDLKELTLTRQPPHNLNLWQGRFDNMWNAENSHMMVRPEK